MNRPLTLKKREENEMAEDNEIVAARLRVTSGRLRSFIQLAAALRSRSATVVIACAV